jgi:hypothetical protein
LESSSLKGPSGCTVSWVWAQKGGSFWPNSVLVHRSPFGFWEKEPAANSIYLVKASLLLTELICNTVILYCCILAYFHQYILFHLHCNNALQQ